MNVLSIDFDIIMAPDIELYNGMVSTSPDGSRSIEQRIKEHPLLGGCRADLKHYQKLIPYVLKVCQNLNVEDIRVSFSHEDIKNLLDGLNDVHVFNIDHHHDLGYPQPNRKIEEEESRCSCANWAEYYINRNIISKLTWLNNTNSSSIPPHWENDGRIDVQTYQTTSLENLPHMDKLFICLSPEWTPSTYHPLFYLMLDLINKEKKCQLPMS